MIANNTRSCLYAHHSVLQNVEYSPLLYIDGTGSRVNPLTLLSGTHPRTTRPLNNRTLWEDGVLEFTQGGISRSVKIDQVYGLLWKLQLANRDKQYFMAHVRIQCGAGLISALLHAMLY